MRFPDISAKTGIYGVIGDPIDHSISPIIQNAAFHHARIDAVYVAFHVKKHDLKVAVEGLLALGIRGFNVTIPHKIQIMRYLDGLDQAASIIGSVNTVVNRKGSLIGFNTDGIGALQAVGVERLKGASVLLLGAGGAARAIAHAFAPETSRIRIMNRSITNARRLERAIRERYGSSISSSPLTQKSMRKFVESAELIVNASSMGMNGKYDPPINQRWLNSQQTIFDIVYTPTVTTLLRNARRAGARTIGGLEMLLNQGAASFELWTGRSAPIREMRNKLSQ